MFSLSRQRATNYDDGRRKVGEILNVPPKNRWISTKHKSKWLSFSSPLNQWRSKKNNIELPKQIIPIVVNGVRGSLEASYCVVCDVTLEKLVVDGSNDKVRSFPALKSSLALCLSTHPLRQRAQKATDANGWHSLVKAANKTNEKAIDW